MPSLRLKNIVLAALAGVAMAGPVGRIAQAANDQTVDVFDSVDNDFISGNVTAIDHFVQVNATPTAGTGTLSVAIKPRDRDTSQANSINNGNHYLVDAGASSGNTNRPNLSISYQFDPGTDNATNYILRLSTDFDPAVNSTDFVVDQRPIFGAGGWSLTDGYFTTNQTNRNDALTTIHNWNQTDVPYVISNSTNLSPGFIPNPAAHPYNQNVAGEYEVRLEVLDPTGTNVLASAVAYANVVPEPTSIGALGLGLCGVLMRRRRAR